MTAISSLIGARRRDARGLQALAVALASVVADTPPTSTDPVEVLAGGDDSGTRTGTWDEVRAAKDYGDLSPAEYDYLSAAMAALTMEDA